MLYSGGGWTNQTHMLPCRKRAVELALTETEWTSQLKEPLCARSTGFCPVGPGPGLGSVVAGARAFE